MLIDLLMIVGGGLILYLGAEWLVKGSAGIAHAFGIKPLVIGLTVVAYGTSAPELAVSTAAILRDEPDIVLGNIIGSCIANLGLILGITALIAPPTVDGRMITREVPVLIASALVVPLVLGWDNMINWWEAAALLACALTFTVYTLGSAARGDDDIEVPDDETGDDDGQSKAILILLTIVGLGALVGGGEVFVRGASDLAARLGMSKGLVGLTIVAIGTSLPELAASIVAATRGMSGLAVGNVVGSNIFNVFLVFGVVGLVDPIKGGLYQYRYEVCFLVGITILGVLAMRGNRRVTRFEGCLLLAAYAAFVAVAIARNYAWL